MDLDILGGRTVGLWFGYGKRDLVNNSPLCVVGDNKGKLWLGVKVHT